jgi:hypothetical protein
MQLRLIAPWLILLGACSSGGTAPPNELPQVVPDFLLLDVNSSSPTFDQDVSPRDSLGLITAWYFSGGT